MPGSKFGRADGGYAVVVGVGIIQTGATPIIEATNLLTSETAQTGFILPAKHPIGSPIYVRVGNVAATIYPAVGGKIDNGAADAVRSVATTKAAVFMPLDDGAAVTNWLCVVSA